MNLNPLLDQNLVAKVPPAKTTTQTHETNLSLNLKNLKLLPRNENPGITRTFIYELVKALLYFSDEKSQTLKQELKDLADKVTFIQDEIQLDEFYLEDNEAEVGGAVEEFKSLYGKVQKMLDPNQQIKQIKKLVRNPTYKNVESALNLMLLIPNKMESANKLKEQLKDLEQNFSPQMGALFAQNIVKMV